MVECGAAGQPRDGLSQPAAEDDWAAERAILARLAEHKADVDMIPPQAFVFVAARISHYKNAPVSDHDMTEMKREGLILVRGRNILDRAARLLRHEVKGWPEHSQHAQRWREAIAVLEYPRDAFDNDKDWLQVSKQGPAMKPWAYMATEIAGPVVNIFQAHVGKAPLGPDSPIVKFTLDALRFIGAEKLPAPKTLSDTLRKKPQYESQGPHRYSVGKYRCKGATLIRRDLYAVLCNYPWSTR
jgi:hypothetical protein